MRKLTAGLKRTALLVAVLALVMGVGAVALTAADNATASQEAIHRSDRLQLADSLATLANGYFLQLYVAEVRLGQQVGASLGSPGAGTTLASGLTTLDGDPLAAVVDHDGLTVLSSTGASGLVPAMGAGATRLVHGQGGFLSSVFQIAGHPDVAIAVPCGSGGDVLLIGYDLTSLPIAAYVQKLEIGPQAVPYIVDANGRLVTSPNPARIGAVAPATSRTAISMAHGAQMVQTPGRSPDVVAVTPVGLGGWQLVIQQPAPIFYGSLWHGDKVFRWTLLSLLVVVAFALLVFHARRQAALQKVADMAVIDHLTGLPNRLAFTKAVDGAMHRHRRGESEVALLFCDLDGFKAVNDRLGHAAGDSLLVAAADRLRAAVISHSTMKPVVARLGGDEFTVLLQAPEVSAAANQLATALTDSFAEPFVLGPYELNVGVSVGVAFAHPDRDLLRDADVAMYRAKAVRKATRAADTPDRFSPTGAEDHPAGQARGDDRAAAALRVVPGV